jgi:ribosomal protein L33
MRHRGARVLKTLACRSCGALFPLWRKPARNRAAGHFKKLYCYRCGRRTTHVELGSQYEDKIKVRVK